MNHIDVLTEDFKRDCLIELYLLSGLIVLNEPENAPCKAFITLMDSLTEEEKHFFNRDKYSLKYEKIETSLKTYRPLDLLMTFQILIYYFVSNPPLDSFDLKEDYPPLRKWADKYLYLTRGKKIF